MIHLRFHIGALVILVLLLGIGFAALRESNEIWDSSIFSLTLVVLAISILLGIHRTEKRRALWLGFALFGWIYLGLTLIPTIESRLITTKALTFLDSKMPRSNPAGAGLGYFEYGSNGDMDLFIVNNSQPIALYRNRGNGTFEDVTSAAGSTTAWFLNSLAGPALTGPSGTTENFVKIGHSLMALIAALLGGQLSKYLRTKKPNGSSAPVPAPVSMTSNSGV